MNPGRAGIVGSHADKDRLDLGIGHDGHGLAQGVLPFLAAAATIYAVSKPSRLAIDQFLSAAA